MRLPFRRQEKALTATSDVISSIRSGWQAFPLLGSGSRQRIMDVYTTAQNSNYAWQYAHSPGLRTVIDCIKRNVGQLELRLFEEISETELKPRPDHPAALSMRYPSANPTTTTTGDGLVRELFLDYLIHNNAYAIIQPNPLETDGRVTLRSIPAYMVEIHGDSMFEVSYYRVWPQGAWIGGAWGGAGTYTDVPPENMLHWHGEHPTDRRIGLSVLDTLSDVIAEDAALQAAITELANAGFQEAVWMFSPENAAELGAKVRRNFEEDLGNRLRRRNRIPIVVEEGREFRSFQVNPRDAQAMEARRWTIERIATAYGMPLGMVGLDANVEAARSEFYADVLPPYCEAFCRMLNLRLNVQIYDWTKGSWQFNLDEKLMGDSRLQALVSASGGPILLRDEARAMINRGKVKGGDELITPLNVQVGDNPKPSPGVSPIQDPNKPNQDGSYRTDQGPTPIPAGGGRTQPQQAPRPVSNGAGKAIPPLQAVIAGHFRRLDRALGSKAAQGREPEWDRWDTELAADLLKALRKVTNGRVESDQLQAKAMGAASGVNMKIRDEVAELGLDAAMARAPQHVAAAGGYLETTVAALRRRKTLI